MLSEKAQSMDQVRRQTGDDQHREILKRIKENKMKTFKEWAGLREDTQSDRAVARHFNADWEKHPCEECGEQARSRSRGITGAGNEEWETECDNQNCPRYKRGPQLSDHI